MRRLASLAIVFFCACGKHSTPADAGPGATQNVPQAGAPQPLVLRGAEELTFAFGGVCARLKDGRVACWRPEHRTSLTQAGIRARAGFASGVADAKRLVGRGGTACVLTRSKKVLCWGRGASGILGTKTLDWCEDIVMDAPARRYACRRDARPVDDLDDVVSIGVGVDHACAARANGEVVCWGAGEATGTSGVPCKLGGAELCTQTPRRVPALSNVVEIATSDATTCARLDGGAVRCWGSGREGQLGDGDTLRHTVMTPVRVVGLDDAVQLAAYGAGFCARTASSKVMCWGDPRGQLLGDKAVKIHRNEVDVSTIGKPESTRILGTGRPAVVQEEEKELVGAADLWTSPRLVCAQREGGAWCWGDMTRMPAVPGVLPCHGKEYNCQRALAFPMIDNSVRRLVRGERYACVIDAEGLVQCTTDTEPMAVVVDPNAGSRL